MSQRTVDEGEAELRAARRAYATELKYLARVRSPSVVEAFATVPREHFLGREVGDPRRRRVMRETA